MIKKLMIMMLVAAMPAVAVGVERISLNSIDGGAEWQLCPQDDLKGVSGCTVAQPGFEMPASAVPGVVPGYIHSLCECRQRERPQFCRQYISG